MKLIVGLGNPGEKYEGTRHNVGFVVVERLLAKITKYQAPNPKQIRNLKWENSKRFLGMVAQGGDLLLLKPDTFMNESGQSVSAAVRFYKLQPEDVYVAHDDLDIRLGEYKLQLGKGPRLHYGVESVERHLSNDQFWRVRVGVENRQQVGNKGVPGMEYVLQKFITRERKVKDEVVGEIVDKLVSVLS